MSVTAPPWTQPKEPKLSDWGMKRPNLKSPLALARYQALLLVLLHGFVVFNTVMAQTATAPNEGSRLTHGSTPGSYDFSWWGQPGRTYFMQHSDNLSAWEYLPLIDSGANGSLSRGFTSTSAKFFLRLRTSDIPTSDPFNADFDGDKVGNWDELLQGTDPLSAADTDGNGLPDDWEKFYFGHIGVDPNATAPGGGMTNLQHFELGTNPNNPPPSPTISAGTATLDQSADTLLYPADDSQLLLRNGNFSEPSLGSAPWLPYPDGIANWTAISGNIIELQQIESNLGGQYCELDSHWPTDDHSGSSDHGIRQTVNLARGHYLLIFDYRGRYAGADSFTVKLQAGTADPVPLAAKSGAATTWKRGSASFDVTGGNPNQTALPVTFLFDIADDPDSFGAFIDNVLLLPVDIAVRKKGTAAAPDDGLIVKKGDVLEIALAPSWFDQDKQFDNLITWQFRQLKSDGTYTGWAAFSTDGNGTKFEYTTDTGGVFQFKAIISVTGQQQEYQYLRKKDELKTSSGYMGPGRKGQPDAVGVCDTQKQIDIRNEAKRYLGSPAYASDVSVPAEYGFSAFGTTGNAIIRCNIFVAHRCCAVGATVPAINGVFHDYPPLANQWAGVQSTSHIPFNFTTAITGWPLLSADTYPQPGFIIAHPDPEDAGHCAIIDYDGGGGGIGAGTSGTVNKNYREFYDGTSRCRQYQP